MICFRSAFSLWGREQEGPCGHREGSHGQHHSGRLFVAFHGSCGGVGWVCVPGNGLFSALKLIKLQCVQLERQLFEKPKVVLEVFVPVMGSIHNNHGHEEFLKGILKGAAPWLLYPGTGQGVGDGAPGAQPTQLSPCRWNQSSAAGITPGFIPSCSLHCSGIFAVAPEMDLDENFPNCSPSLSPRLGQLLGKC